MNNTVNRLSVPVVAAVITLASASSANAYVGPGLGVGTLAVVLGVVGSVFLAVFATIWYPLKRRIRGRRQSVDAVDPTAPE